MPLTGSGRDERHSVVARCLQAPAGTTATLRGSVARSKRKLGGGPEREVCGYGALGRSVGGGRDPSSDTDKSHEEQWFVRARKPGASGRHRSNGPADPGDTEAAADLGRLSDAVCRLPRCDRVGAVPAERTVPRRSREAVALQSPVLRVRRTARAPLRRSRQPQPCRGAREHPQGRRRSGRRVGVDRVLRQLRRLVTLLGHRVGGLDHDRAHRRARGRAEDLHSAAAAGRAAPTDRDRRHRRACGATVAHVPAASRPRLRSAGLRRAGRHRRARWRQSARHPRPDRKRPARARRERCCRVAIVGRQGHQRARPTAHRSRLSRRALDPAFATST